MDTVYQLVLSEALTREELIHKLLISLGNRLGNSLTQTINTVLHLLGYLSSRHISLNCASVLILISLHLDEVYIRNYLSVSNNGNNYRANCRSELGFELCKNVIEVSIVIIKLGNYEDRRLAHSLGILISLVSSYLNARLSRYSDKNTAACKDTLDLFTLIVKQTRSVKKVYLEAACCFE